MATLDGPLDINGNVKTNLPLALGQAGYATLTGEIHDGGAVNSKAALRRSTNISIEKRLGIGMDTLMWEDVFNHAVINTRKYQQILTTMTAAMAGGFLTLNSGSSVAATVGALLKGYRTFPVLANFPTIIDFEFSLGLVPQANNNIFIGLGVPGASATAIPTDGVFLVIDNAGALQLQSIYNGGAATTSGTITFPFAANRVYHGEIVIHTDRAELYLDGSLYGTIDRSAAFTVGSMSMNQSGQLIAQIINTAATAGAQKLNIARWAVTLGDGNHGRTWAQTRGSIGDHSLSAPDGAAVAALQNIANNTAPVTAGLSNTVAGYATNGGNFQFAAPATAETDYLLFAYQVPALTNASQGKNFVLQGVEIDTKNMGAAVATTLTNLEWYVGIGATAASLATVDSATTKAGHRFALGSQSFNIGDGIGKRADRNISLKFDTPLVLEPGSFIQWIVRVPVGTATASQLIRGNVSPIGYFE